MMNSKKRKKMKTTKKTILTVACAMMTLLGTTSCSNDNELAGTTPGSIDATKKLQFELNFADYNAEDTVDHATRAAMDAKLAKPQIVKLNDMVYAEVSMQRDTTKTPEKAPAATRALTNGTYTIYAYQGTTLKGTLKGTVVGNVFTATSSNEEIGLAPGTYNFVCCNDKVSVVGETWTVNRTDAETARIGIANSVVITPTPQKQKVSFQMKHVGARARIALVGEGFPVNNITGTLTSTSNIPASVEFNTSTQTYSTASTEALSVAPSFTPFNYQADSQYMYFLPGTTGSQLKLSLTGGTAYRLPVAGRTVTFPALTSMAANGSYTLRLVLHYNYIYLYSDGTTGQYTDATHSSKTPIAVVVSRSKRLAIALNDAVSETTPSFSSSLWSASSLKSTQSMTTMGQSNAANLADFNGEDYTWTTTYSTDGIVKGNDATNYPAFYAAAHYNPGVPVTGANVGRWFMPTVGEWNLYRKNVSLDNGDLYTGGSENGHIPDYFAFSRVGGTRIPHRGDGHTNTIHLLASEADPTYFWGTGIETFMTTGWPSMPAWYSKDIVQISKDYTGPLSFPTNLSSASQTSYRVRPFVHY